MARRNNSAAGGCGLLLGGLLLIGLAIMIVEWALITAAILVVPFGIWFVLDRNKQREQRRAVEAKAARRAEIEGRAVVDAGRGCGWCGSRIAHQDSTGAVLLPRDYHREEIEDAIALTE